MTARVAAVHVWPPGSDTPQRVDELVLDWGGPVGDRHHGLTMSSDVRQKPVYPRGTEIRNHRQVSIVDVGELAEIAVALGLPELAPGTIADNICTEGIDDLTSLPPLSRLVFEGGAVILVGGENLPCTIAGGLVGERYGTRPERFPKAAMGLRGVTGWVEHPGVLRPGTAVTVVPPTGM
ncbi:MAG: MOSC domain-containing protein [Candidatus Nanopelagicales bacterium]